MRELNLLSTSVKGLCCDGRGLDEGRRLTFGLLARELLTTSYTQKNLGFQP